MVRSGIRLKSADDIARARGGVFDDDHPLAYTGGGVGSTKLQCGSSALATYTEPDSVRGSLTTDRLLTVFRRRVRSVR